MTDDRLIDLIAAVVFIVCLVLGASIWMAAAITFAVFAFISQ
jgi:hypothetical protein